MAGDGYQKALSIAGIPGLFVARICLPAFGDLCYRGVELECHVLDETGFAAPGRTLQKQQQLTPIGSGKESYFIADRKVKRFASYFRLFDKSLTCC